MIVLLTYIDSVTGIPVTEQESKNGPKLPNLPELEVLWSKSSEYPTATPKFVCRVTRITHPAILEVWTEEQEQQEYQKELEARRLKEVEILSKPIRSERAQLLKDSDLYMILDYPISQEKRSEWALYRQALRDITLQPNFPYEVTWPIKPE